MKSSIIHCQHCKKTGKNLKLMVNCTSVSRVTGKKLINYICRKCNTERSKIYRKTEKGKTNTYKSVYKSVKFHPAENRARANLNYHVGKGHIIKPKKCSHCNKQKRVEGHHADYNFPLNVVWLCRSCRADLEYILKKR